MVPRLFVFAGFCVLVAALWAAQDLLVPVALAVLFTFLLAPLVRKLERSRIPHPLAVMGVVTATLLVVLGIGWIVFIQLNNLYDNLPAYREEIVSKIQRVRTTGAGFDKLEELSKDIENAAAGNLPTSQPTSQPTTAPTTAPTTPPTIASALTQANPLIPQRHNIPTPPEIASPPPAQVAGASPESPLYVAPVENNNPLEAITAYLTPFLGPIGTAGLVFVLVIFMLLQREDLRDRIILLMGRSQFHLTTQALDDAGSRISRYILAQAIVNGTYGIAISIGLWMIGAFVGNQTFPSFVLWGLLCALLRFIPYIGPWIAAAFPLLVAIAVYPGFAVFAWVLGMIVVIELASNNLMEPILYGSSTGMNTLAIIISAMFWTWLWGPIGLILATPLTVCLVVLGKHVPQLNFLDTLLGDQQVLDPPARIYQRLLAHDQEEALDLVTDFFDDMELLQVYETVLLPTLAMCETDHHAGQLDEALQKYIHSAIRDMIDELGDQARARIVQQKAAAEVDRAKNEPDAPPPVATHPPRANVLCLPASDQADELVGLMLAQLLQQRDCAASTLSINSLASEMIEHVQKAKPDVVVVSALPPSATTRARYLCKRLQGMEVEPTMLVGLWTVTENLERARDRLTCVASVRVVNTLTDALDQLRQLTHQARVGSKTIEKE